MVIIGVVIVGVIGGNNQKTISIYICFLFEFSSVTYLRPTILILCITSNVVGLKDINAVDMKCVIEIL